MAVGQNCESCGAALGMGASFCRDCGASVRLVNDMKCPTCGNDNEEYAQFCGGCGTYLSAPIASGIGAASSELPMTSFIDAIKLGFSNYFNFSGRATRAEYWWFVLFLVPLSLITWIPLIGQVIWLATTIPGISLATRRLHDIGKKGWWQLLFWIISIIAWSASISFLFVGLMASEEGDSSGFLFLLSGVALVVAIAVIAIAIKWFVRKGDEGPNKYGPDPRQAT